MVNVTKIITNNMDGTGTVLMLMLLMLRHIKLFAANIFISLPLQRHSLRSTQTVQSAEEKSDSEQREIWSARRISSEIDQTVHSDITRLFWCTAVWYCSHSTMYCLQWLIPVLLLPKPVRFSRNFLLTKCFYNFFSGEPSTAI